MNIDVTRHTCEGERRPRCRVEDLRCSGLFLWRRPWFVSLREAPSSQVVTAPSWAPSGRVCPGFGVAMAIATAFPMRWPLYTPGPPGQLSAQFSCKVQNTDNVCNVWTSVITCPPARRARSASHLCDARPARTQSSYTLRCWSRRHEKGCVRNTRSHESCSDWGKRHLITSVSSKHWLVLFCCIMSHFMSTCMYRYILLILLCFDIKPQNWFLQSAFDYKQETLQFSLFPADARTALSYFTWEFSVFQVWLLLLPVF